MIANYKEEGWQVITQRAHGLLAAQLAAQWRENDRPARWMETVLAIAEHDDAENELDGEELLTPTGGPLHFSMKKFDLAHCRQLSALTITKSRYIALLTSLHMSFVYGEFARTDKAAKAFLEEQQQQQETWRKELGMTKEEVLRIYNLVEWCDAFSLLLCKGELQPEKRKVEISSGPDKKMYYLTQLNESMLTVEPWPFQMPQFEVRFESRTLTQLQFSSSKEFRAAFLAAPVSETAWTLARKKPSTKEKTVKVKAK